MKTLYSRRHLLKSMGSGILAYGLCGRAGAQTAESDVYVQRALEVTDYVHKNLWNKKSDLYKMAIDKDEPDHIWGGGVMFSAVVAAARHDPRYKSIMRKFYEGLNSYWDSKVRIPGYEPSPTGGNGNNKYYDDNAWMVITFLEAYEVSGDSRYLRRANETLDFVMSGWDEEAGGGIWWHERHEGGGKNTCANGPAAVGCFRISKFGDPKASARRIADGGKIVKWTTQKLRGSNGLFGDAINVATGVVNGGQLTYNSALMLRAYLCLYACTGEDLYLDEAKQMGVAAKSFLGDDGAYRDSVKWSHLMVEADLELYRWTKEDYLLKRAKKDCDVHYAEWKANPAKDLITNGGLARQLWLLAEMETAVGMEFWRTSDRLRK